MTVDGDLAGNAFACRWRQGEKNICWVTQLVVDKEYRERGLASGLLRSLRLDADDIYGVMSSHAAACLAAASTLGSKYNIFYHNAEPNSDFKQQVSRRYLLASLRRMLKASCKLHQYPTSEK